MKPMTSFDPKSLNLYLPQLESLNTWHTEANQELFPRKSLSQALSENIKPGSDFIGAHMRVQRPSVDGMANAPKLYTNCNALNASNTQNLAITIPRILPSHTNQMSGPQSKNREYDFAHETPNYLNVACLPFAQQFYSLDSFDELRYPRNRKEQSTSTQPSDTDLTSKPHQYKSAFSAQESRDRKISLGKKLLAFAHYDLLNRTKLLTMAPVYGQNLRHAVKIALVLSAELYEPKRHKYVDRRSKMSQSSVRECYSVPSTVLNPLAMALYRSSDSSQHQYELPCCKVSDFDDS